MFDLLGFFRGGFLGSNIDCLDLYAGQFAAMTDGAVITLAPLVFKGDDLLVLALFDNFSGHLCSRNERIPMSYIFSVGKQKYVAKGGSLARFDIEQIDIDRVALCDAKLPATSSDDCVSHSFPGEKEPPIIP